MKEITETEEIKMEKNEVEMMNEELKIRFKSIKSVYLIFFTEPFILFAIMIVVRYFFGIGIDEYLLRKNITGEFFKSLSLVFIILSAIEYYSIVVAVKKTDKIIGKIRDIKHFVLRYRRLFFLLLLIAGFPSVCGFVYYLLSSDIIFSSLFYLISLVSIARVYPRFEDFRSRYIDLREDI